MTIEQMEYDYKVQLNELDSNRYRGLRIPEIDWKLNQAQMIFISTITNPRVFQGSAFEFNQRSIDDVSTIVVNNKEIPTTELSATEFAATLPSDYLHFASGYAKCKKGLCENTIRTYVVQHDDRHEEDFFSKSSFEWEEVNSRFFDGGYKMFTDGTFDISHLVLNYVRKPKYMHNAKDTPGGVYRLPDGRPLSNKQDCELPESAHRPIVSLAVLLTTGDLRLPDYQIKLNNFKLTNNG